jgi:periplasmic divalent cation tolerance protein
VSAPPLDPSGDDRRLRVVYTAVPNAEIARILSQRSVELGLAGCASFWPISSTYRWKGSLETAEEQALLFKTSPKKLGKLFRYIAQKHPYEVPDIFEIRVPRVHEPYLEWLLGSIDPGSIEGAVRRNVSRRGSQRARGAPARRRTPVRLRHR